MQKISLNKNWEYIESTLQNPLLVNMLQGWKKIDLPHDYSVEKPRTVDAPSGLDEGFMNGAGLYYKKTFVASKKLNGKRVWLEFEGVSGVCEVWVNKKFAAKHTNSYTTFIFEITSLISAGDNEITIHTDNRKKPDSRWYVGCGLYRGVNLYVADKKSVPPYGLKVTTKSVDANGNAVLSIEANVSPKASVNYEIVDDNIILCSVFGTNKVQMQVSGITPWSVENPYLYTVRATYGKDVYEVKTGIRTVTVNSKEGLKINGQSVKLKGGCIHHDLGILGAADYEAAERRRIQKLKQSGFNAVRLAHNPYGPAIFKVCDEEGMLCIEEAFDEWVLGRTSFGLHTTFEDRWERDLADMINRDYNHPSIIMWSTGNEVEERDGSADGFEWSKKLAKKVKSLDLSRPVSATACALFSEYGNAPASGTTGNQALNMAYDAFAEGRDIWGPATEKYFAPLDVAGYNYKVARYAYDGEKYPNRVIYGSESYPRAALSSWIGARDNNNVIGDFVWTAWDYIGEVGVGRYDISEAQRPSDPAWPWLTAYCSDIDLLGEKRPQSYYRDVIWGVAEKPALFCLPPKLTGKHLARLSWCWLPVERNYTFKGEEGAPIEAYVYADCDEVELIQNGKSLSKKPCGLKEEYIAVFSLNYEPGELVAISYKNGKEVARDSLKTSGAVAGVKFDNQTIAQSDGSLCFVTIQAIDNDGNDVYSSSDLIEVEYKGEGKLIATGTANPKPDVRLPFISTNLNMYCGKAMAIVRGGAGDRGGVLTVKLNGNSFETFVVFAPVAPEKNDYVTDSLPSAADLKLGELMANEKALKVLKKHLGQMLENPMIEAMKGMTLSKLLSMGGQGVSEQLKKELNQAMGI